MALNLESLPKLKNPYKHTVESLWADDTGRESNSGKYSGTFIGFFDTLELEFGETNQSEMEELREKLMLPILDDLTFKDTNTGLPKTEDFIGPSSIPGETINYKRNRYKGFTIKLSAVESRSDM